MNDTTKWLNFIHTIDVLVASALAQDDMKQSAPGRTILFTMPAAAAASTGAVTQQDNQIVSWRLIQSRREDTYALVIEWKHSGLPPTSLVVEDAEGLDFAERRLPDPDADRKIRMLLNTRDHSDAHFIELLTKPLSKKVFER